MPYIRRNAQNEIIGRFENIQPGLAEEFMENPFDFLFEKEKKLKEINDLENEALLLVTDGYTNNEIRSWLTQEGEAIAWSADSNAPTPFLDGIVANKAGTTKASLVTKVLDKAASSKSTAGAVTGKKQSYIDSSDDLNNTATQSDFDAIIISY